MHNIFIVLIYNYIMTNNGEDLFICLFAICISDEVSLQLSFLMFSFKISLHILNTSPLSDMCFIHIFSSSVACFLFS